MCVRAVRRRQALEHKALTGSAVRSVLWGPTSTRRGRSPRSLPPFPPLPKKKHSVGRAKKGSQGAGRFVGGLRARLGGAPGNTDPCGAALLVYSRPSLDVGLQEAGLAASSQLQLDSFSPGSPPKQLSTRRGEGCIELSQLGTTPLTLSLADCSVRDLEAVEGGWDLLRVEGGSVILVRRRCVGAQPCPCGLGVRR